MKGMIVPGSGPQFSEYKFKPFAMKCRLTLVFPSCQYTQSNGSKKNQVMAGKCCEACYEVLLSYNC